MATALLMLAFTSSLSAGRSPNAKSPAKSPARSSAKSLDDWQQFQLMFRQRVSHATTLNNQPIASAAAAVQAARQLSGLRKFSEAKATLARRLGHTPLSAADERLLSLELATVQLHSGAHEAAKQTLERLQRLTPSDRPQQRLRYLWADYYQQTDQPRKARQILTALISEAPQFVLGYTLLSQTYLSRGKLALAEDVLLRAQDNGLESPAIQLKQGVIAMKSGKQTAARQLFRKVLGAQPDNVVARVNLGISYLQDKRFKEAEKALLAARKLAPKRSFCHFALGVLYHRQQKLKKARESYRLALQGPATSPYLRYNYAMLLFKHQKNDPKGLQYLFEVTQMAQPNSDIYKIARSLLAKAEDHR